MARSLPVARRLLYGALVLLLVLAAVEGGLALVPLLLLCPLAAVPEGGKREILCLGDSVTFGSGLARGQAWPEQLEQQLRDRGVANTKVLNFAREGHAGFRLDPRADALLEQLDPGAGPIVLSMLGHNDFVWWDDEASGSPPFGGVDHRGYRAADYGAGVAMGGEPPVVRGLPRLPRALRWVASALRDEPPSVEVDAARRARFMGTMGKTRDRVRGLGGELWLLTYVPPGAVDPASGLSDDEAALVAASHEGQARVNQAIREIAGELGVPVLDLERLVSLPDTWDPHWHWDNMHLTRHGSERVASAVREYLATTAGLPAEAMASPHP